MTFNFLVTKKKKKKKKEEEQEEAEEEKSVNRSPCMLDRKFIPVYPLQNNVRSFDNRMFHLIVYI